MNRVETVAAEHVYQGDASITATYVRIAILALLGLLALTTRASAEEPKGFLTWQWGTTKETMFKEKGRGATFLPRKLRSGRRSPAADISSAISPLG